VGDTQQDLLGAFRHHRHDVVNSLQVIRAYIQMGRSEKAVQSVDELAAWLRSLAVWQACVGTQDEELVWNAAVCPNLQLVSAPRITFAETQRREVKQAWLWLNEFAQVKGNKFIYIKLEAEWTEPSDLGGRPVMWIDGVTDKDATWREDFQRALPPAWPTTFEIRLRG